MECVSLTPLVFTFYKHTERKKLLQKPSYLSDELQKIPRVIPEEVELESLDMNDNQMHRCSDETTPTKQNIPRVTPEKVELEPLSKDEKEVNQMHQCLDETTPTTRNIPGVIPKEVELEPLAEDEWDGNKMHQCADEMTTTKKNILGVIPEEVELDPMTEDEWDGNKMHQCADEMTTTKKNILGVIPEEVELDPMTEDERDGNKMHQSADEATPTKKNILRVISVEVELECLAKDEKDVNQIHQCLDESTPTKKDILGVIPEEVELESLAENEDEKLSSDNGDFSDGGPQKKRDEKKRCTQQKIKIQRRVTSKKKESVGWGSKSLIDFLRYIGQDTRQKLSPYDVTSMVCKYVKEHNLIHPVEKRRILCDVQLESIFGKKVVNKERLFSLLESHFVENEERLQKDELDHDLEDDDTEMLVASKTEKKVEQTKRPSIWYSTAAQSQFAALIPENIKLVYLKRSLVLEMIKKPESIETKIIGSFVRVKLEPRDFEQHNSHQLVQITGIKHGSSDKCNSESLIQVSNMAGDVCLTMLSDDEFSKEECDELRKKVKAGLQKKLTIVEVEQKAKILHEDITNHRIARELELALQNIPRVIPEEEEL
ncbi:zinc finger CCCH domain-containing protein 19-like isoform X2 [Solanum dulcamara]|uniref:zinc finger CCCH domain-containing protein 19-like isoform X2 n=1 Tax=Solanum dulcamara TaxID=45834 RepID=UPI0024858D9A|nr:zinc finger CCCH domain-containing protein 19-like isoform X2 [Solanum dulcamara]